MADTAKSQAPTQNEQPQQVNVQNNEQNNVQTFKNRTIVRIFRNEQDPKRYTIEVDGEPFDGFNNKNERIKTNTFSLNVTTLCKQIGNKHALLNLAFTMSSVSNGTLNPMIVSVALQSGQLTLTREYVTADTISEATGEPYGNDFYRNTITEFKPNTTPEFTAMLAKLINNPDTLTIKDKPQADEEEAIANLFAQ